MLEAFTTTHGHPSAPISTFTAHGYCPFLASAIRFMAAYERVYSTDPPLQQHQRKITTSESFLTEYDVLHPRHVNAIEKQGPYIGKVGEAAYFTLTLLDMKTWDLANSERIYNFHIPPASLIPEIHNTHSLMVSHGITMLSAILSYGSNPIILTDPRIAHIEQTMGLCVKATEKYWVLINELPKEGKFAKDKDEMYYQKRDIRETLGVCDLVRRDLGRARDL